MSIYSDISMGGYSPGNSPAHRLDPRLKVIMIGIFSLAVWFVDTPIGLGLMSAMLITWTLLGKGFALRMLASAKSLIYIVLAILLYYCISGALNSIDNWTAGMINGLYKAILFCVKLALLWLAASWMTLSTTPQQVVEALSYLLRPLSFTRLPVREFSFTVGLILRFFPDSVARIGDFHRQLKMRECLASTSGEQNKSFFRKLARITEAMALYMNYSLHRSGILALSLVARGYNPFRVSNQISLEPPGIREFGFTLLSVAWIFTCAWWM
jgi:energy-coupling factor transport system permease protein